MSQFNIMCRLYPVKGLDVGITAYGAVGNRWYVLVAKEAGPQSQNPGLKFWDLRFVDVPEPDAVKGPDESVQRAIRETGLHPIVVRTVAEDAARKVCSMFRPQNPDANYSLGGNTARRRYLLFPRFLKGKSKDKPERAWDLSYVEAPRESDPFDVSGEQVADYIAPPGEEDELPF
jgi:hypothetical protein